MISYKKSRGNLKKINDIRYFLTHRLNKESFFTIIYIFFYHLCFAIKRERTITKMNTQQLHCFLRVADKLNFTRAAEVLFLSVPTVTHHIKSLEEELGTALFIRTPKFVRLTDAGTNFYSDAKDILERLDMAKMKIARTVERDTVFFRIGCTCAAELFFTEKILNGTKGNFPEVIPRVSVEDYMTLRNLFINDQIDAMFCTADMIKDVPDCTFKKLRTATTCIIPHADSPLASAGEVMFEDLENERLVTIHPRLVPFEYARSLHSKISERSHTHFDIICDNEETVIMLVKCGYGTALLPDYCVAPEQMRLRTIPLHSEKNEYDTDYGIAFHRGRRSAHLSEFINKASSISS